MVVIRLIKLVHGPPTPHDGRWLVAYDPTWRDVPAFDGLQIAALETSEHAKSAKKFDSTAAAMAYAMQVSPNKRFREDSALNRPLRAFHLVFEPSEDT